MAPRHLVIGDVHGMTSELRALIELLHPNELDVIVFLGDLLDKGPDSAGTVRYARALAESELTVKLVKGNHEDRHERYRKAFARAGDAVKMAGLDELRQITAELSREDVAFLETAELVVQVPGGVAVHGGVLPTMRTLHDLGKAGQLLMRVRHVTGQTVHKLTYELTVVGDEPPTADEIAALVAHTEPVRSKTRPAGSFISLGKETEQDPFWADVYDGRFGTVYFGHSPFQNVNHPVEYPHAVGLDLGAVFGNRLAAAIIEEDGTRTYASVPASARYCNSYWDDA